MKPKILITTDGVCDLPEDILQKYLIPSIHFYITTDHGIFRDLDEITSANIIEYFENGGQFIATHAPSIDDFEEFFETNMKKYECEEIIHITISSFLSKSTEHAVIASEKFNGKIHVFDSAHLSVGVAYFVLAAAEMVQAGKNREEILDTLQKMKSKVSTTFITEDADYLYRNNRVNKFVKKTCELLKIHPTLGLKKGNMYLKAIRFGSYQKAILRYVKSELTRSGKIDSKRVFLVHASCSVKTLATIKEVIASHIFYEELIITKASATISSNCGANAVAVIFLKEG